MKIYILLQLVKKLHVKETIHNMQQIMKIKCSNTSSAPSNHMF